MVVDNLTTKCTSKACKAIAKKGRPGIVTNRGTDGHYAACRDCARVYEPIRRNNEVPKVKK